MDGSSAPAVPVTVLQVLEAVGGGTAKHLVDLVEHVADVRHVAAVPEHRLGGLSDDGIVARLRAAGAEVHVIPMRRSPAGPENGVAVLRLRRLIRRLGPHVVHAHASIGGAVASLARAGTRTQLLWTPHAVNTAPLYTLAERALFRTATVIALSESERRLIERLKVADGHRLQLIPNGIRLATPAQPPRLRDRLGIPPRAPVVGTVGRLVHQKAPLDFVSACAHVARSRPDAHFVLVGDGPLAAAVDAEVARHRLTDRFHRLHLPAGAAGVIGEFDAFLLCSRYEGAPYTPLEAMAAGVPVVLTGCVGSRDTVAHGHSGLVVPPGDPLAMAGAALRLLEEPALRARLRRGARQRLTERFDVTEMARRYGQLYRALAAAAARPAGARVAAARVAGGRLATLRAPTLAGYRPSGLLPRPRSAAEPEPLEERP